MAGLSRNAAQKGSASASHAAVRESLNGPSPRLMRCSDLSGVEVKADSKSIASFGRC